MTTRLEQLVGGASQRYEQRFGAPPRWIVAAPGRVNLIGEHVDYCDGFVMPMALDRYTVIAAGEAPGDEARLTSSLADDEAVVSLADPRKHDTPRHWSNYVAGVIAGCRERGMQPGGFQAVIESDVPLGSGLSSSAALEVSTATLIEAMTGTELDLKDKALLCQKAEHEYAGMPCGIMDQFISAMGQADHLTLLDCRSQEVEQIPMTDPGVTVLVTNSNVKHELTGSEYPERRAACEAAAKGLGLSSLRDATAELLEARRGQLSDVEYRRARHVIGEIARTTAAADALKAGNWPRVGELMYASHDSLRDDFEVSCPEIDVLVELARGIGPAGGVIGSRITGGGFGGCTVTLVATDKVDEVVGKIVAGYKEKLGIDATPLTSRPSQGAHVVKG